MQGKMLHVSVESGVNNVFIPRRCRRHLILSNSRQVSINFPMFKIPMIIHNPYMFLIPSDPNKITKLIESKLSRLVQQNYYEYDLKLMF